MVASSSICSSFILLQKTGRHTNIHTQIPGRHKLAAGNSAAHGATDVTSPNDIADPFVGRSVRKKFVGAGVFDGVVASAHSTKQGSYIVAWTDGMQTTMSSSALGKCLVTLPM